MSHTARAALCCVLALGSLTWGAEEPPPEPGVTIQRLEAGLQIRAVLPGRLLGYALPALPSGRREIHLLVAPEREARQEEGGQDAAGTAPGGEEDAVGSGGERKADPVRAAPLLLRLETGGAGGLTLLSESLPPDVSSLDAADLDGDGTEEVLAFEPGRVWRIRGAAGPRGPVTVEPLLEDRRISAGRLDPALIRSGGLEGARHLTVPLMGAMLLYAASPGGGWDPAPEVELPLDASLKDGVLRLASPQIHPLGPASGGRPLYGVGPRPTPGFRLHTLLLDPLASGDDPRRAPVWSRLPGPEKVMESFFVALDGRPVLLVSTRSAEKLSFFAEKRIRVYALETGDRSRSGAAPLEAFESGANLWQGIRPAVRDVNGDGLDDIILAYWRGLKDDTLVLDVHLRRPGGRRPRGPVTTHFDVEDADRSVLGYGRDLDGDGLPDLLLKTERGETRIYRGRIPGRKGRDLAEKKPRWAFPTRGVSWEVAPDRPPSRGGGPEELFAAITGGAGRPRLADLDGDGDLELLAVRSSSQGRGRFWVTDLDR